jgi:hypothetical protein
MKAKDLRFNKIIKIKKIDDLLKNNALINESKKNIQKGNLLIVKNVIDKNKIKNLKKYLIKIGSSSLPKYEPISHHSPNHHRIVRSDPRSFVKGCFHQFSFFPWNQDLFNLFEITKKCFWLKNLLAGKKKDVYLNISKKSNVVSRVAFQFYPKGEGYLNLHQDPVGFHQVTAPLLIMSEKNQKGDFQTGGSYVLDKKDKKIFIEDYTTVGDLVIYNAAIPHGVEKIDKKSKPRNWEEFNGRWMMLIATNKISGNNKVSDSKDLG